MRFVLIVLVAMCCALSTLIPGYAADDVPLAEQGVIDLTQWDFTDGEIAYLDGSWEFYWNKLLVPQDFSTKEKSPAAFLRVPGDWNNSPPESGQVSGQGYGTYRLKVKLSNSELLKPKGLYISSVASAYKLWVDGELLAENGKIGTDPAEMQPKNYAKIVLFTPKHSEVEIVIQVANFSQRKGGLWKSIGFASEETILYKRDLNVAYGIFVIGCLFIMALYHFAIYLIRRKNKSPLFFGALCLSIVLRSLLLDETLLVRFFPQIDWTLAVKVEYITIVLSMVFIVLFAHTQYGAEMNKRFRNFFVLVGLAFSLFVLVTPPRIFTYGLTAIEVYLLVSYLYIIAVHLLAAIRKRPGSLLNGIGHLAFLLTIINEILYYRIASSLGSLVPLGLLVFLFTQMLNLSITFAQSLTRVENLSAELQQINESLEEKIAERTVALQEANAGLQRANEELSTMEQSRRKLLTNISHELGTPLTSIQGYIKAMIDGIVKADDPKFLRLIYDKTVFLHRIIRDLFELTKMEAKQVPFDYSTQGLVPYVRKIYEKFAHDLKKDDLQFVLESVNSPIAGRVPLVSIDVVRIEQVFSNLLVNAAKYTPAGGTIRLRVGLLADEKWGGHAVISVEDTGKGIDEKDLPYIFDRFYKGSEQSRKHAAGVGLGLAISKEIIAIHQGTMEVESSKGAGSTFRFTLPVRFVPAEEYEEVI